MATIEQKLQVEQLVKQLKGINGKRTMETQLLEPKLIRALYKILGEPEEKDFPEIYNIAGRYWKKFSGYTTYIEIATERSMEHYNGRETYWRIARPSQTKIQIEREYSNAGWACEVQAYNVICGKYVKHPQYKDIWVYFYSSKDCNKYSYVIVKE